MVEDEEVEEGEEQQDREERFQMKSFPLSDSVLVHGMAIREEGQRVPPKLSIFSLSTIIGIIEKRTDVRWFMFLELHIPVL